VADEESTGRFFLRVPVTSLVPLVFSCQALLAFDPVERYKDYEAALTEARALTLNEPIVVSVQVGRVLRVGPSVAFFFFRHLSIAYSVLAGQV
jgi:hypothetical protein